MAIMRARVTVRSTATALAVSALVIGLASCASGGIGVDTGVLIANCNGLVAYAQHSLESTEIVESALEIIDSEFFAFGALSPALVDIEGSLANHASDVLSVDATQFIDTEDGCTYATGYRLKDFDRQLFLHIIKLEELAQDVVVASGRAREYMYLHLLFRELVESNDSYSSGLRASYCQPSDFESFSDWERRCTYKTLDDADRAAQKAHEEYQELESLWFSVQREIANLPR